MKDASSVHPARGRAMMLASTLAFASMGLLVKALPTTVGSSEKVFYRSFLGLWMLVAFYKASGIPIGKPNNIKGLFLRGIFGATALLCFFYSIDRAGLVKGTLYCYTYPIFAAVIAWTTKEERPTTGMLLALAVAALGTTLTLDTHGWTPTFNAGDVAGLLSGLLSGAAVTSIRRLHRTDSSVWIVIAFTTVSSVLAVPPMIGHASVPTGWIIPGLVGVAAFATVAQVLMTSAYRHLTAVEGSILSLTGVPLSAILAMLVLGERQSIRFWVGASLVFGVAVVMNLRSTEPPPE